MNEWLRNPYAGGGLFGQYERMLQPLTETLAHGFWSVSAQREASNEYQYNRDKRVFKGFLSLWFGRKKPQHWKVERHISTQRSFSAIKSM